MKRTSTVLLIAALSSTSTAALSAESVFPSAAQEFAPIVGEASYMDRNRVSARSQPTFAGPTSAVMWDPIQAHDTYMLRHLRDIETQRSGPFPYSTPD
jgi:hypothetical protein